MTKINSNIILKNNNTNEITKNIAKGFLKENILIVSDKENDFEIRTNDIVEFIKENDQSKLVYIFSNQVNTKGTYYIKEYNLSTELDIKTNSIKRNEKELIINYDLIIDNQAENYELKIIYMEV